MIPGITWSTRRWMQVHCLLDVRRTPFWIAGASGEHEGTKEQWLSMFPIQMSKWGAKELHMLVETSSIIFGLR